MQKGEFSNINGFLLDMDGTFFIGNQLLPGALEFLALLNRRRMPFLFLTNNSSRSKQEYVHKLVQFGISEVDARVFTSGEATALYIRGKTAYTRIYLVGTSGLHETFREAGLELVEDQPEVVVLGYDTSLTYAKLDKMCKFLAKGLPFIATHPDINCPTEWGFSPDIGAMLALVKSSTGRDPNLVVGKPNHMIVEMAAGKLGLEPTALAMIGDRLYTDIAMGMTAGLKTILVLTGETKETDLAQSIYKPDLVFDNLLGVMDALT